LLVAVCAAAWALSPGLREEVGLVIGPLSEGDVEGVRARVLAFGAWAPAVSLALMVLQAVIAPIPAFAITAANGLVFGAFWGSVVGLAGRVLAALVCFSLARTLGRGIVEALAGEGAARRSEAWLEEWGVPAVLAARLVPFFPFDAVSYAAGLSRMRLAPFLAATAAGELPGVVLYSWVSAQAPAYLPVLLLTNLALLSAFVATTLLLRRRRNRAAAASRRLPISERSKRA